MRRKDCGCGASADAIAIGRGERLRLCHSRAALLEDVISDSEEAAADPREDETGASWADRFWTSRDGLKLHYRDYPGRADRPPVIMLHGLTRNSRDFAGVAARHCGDWRMIGVDFRGRGLSEWDDNTANYSPPTYARDVIELLDELKADTAVFLGTSLGGLVTMGIAADHSDRIAGVMLNDIGPELDSTGIDRIMTYVGQPARFADWDEAARQFEQRHGEVHPSYGQAQWRAYARRVCRETEQGIEFDYDLRIAEPFNQSGGGVAPDSWPLFRALAGRPVLVLRGESSDLLSQSTLERMEREIPDVETVTVPGVAHAPDLDEPEAAAAIARLLDRVLAATS